MNLKEEIMDFSDLLRRADLNSIEEYLMHGGESIIKSPDATYAERLKEAQEKAAAFFEARYPDMDEYDEIFGYYNEQVSVYQDIYFEIGLILGAKIAFQLHKKLEELS